MDYVITLIADARQHTLTQDEVSAFAKEVIASEGKWLEAGVACDIYTSHPTLPAPLPFCDMIMQAAPKPSYKLLISDMDSTMIEQECIDELADFVGKKAHVAAITERAMRGELVFEEALIERVALLKGLPEATLQECFDKRITLMPGSKELVAAFKNAGGKCVLVSGGFTFFTSRVAAALGFDEHYANTLEIEDGKLTGRVLTPILGKEAKLATLQTQCETLGITAQDVLAIGDGANDLPMLQAAGLGVAYHAKPLVREQTNAQINHCDLSALIRALSLRSPAA